MKAYISDHGLPRAVISTDALPVNAFVGFLCYVETGDDKGLYQYDGSSYALVSASATPSDDPSASPPTVTVVTEYDTVSAFPSEDASAGELAYATSTKAVYYYNGSAWKKLSADSGVVVAPSYEAVASFPESPTAGQLAWCTDTTDAGLYVYDGTAWKKVTVA